MFSFKFRHLGHIIPPHRKNVNTNVTNVNNNGPFKLPMINKSLHPLRTAQ